MLHIYIYIYIYIYDISRLRVNVDVWCAMAATRTVFFLMLICYILTRVFENLSDYNRTHALPHQDRGSSSHRKQYQPCIVCSDLGDRAISCGLCPPCSPDLKMCEFQSIKMFWFSNKSRTEDNLKEEFRSWVLNFTNRIATCNKQRVC